MQDPPITVKARGSVARSTTYGQLADGGIGEPALKLFAFSAIHRRGTIVNPATATSQPLTPAPSAIDFEHVGDDLDDVNTPALTTVHRVQQCRTGVARRSPQQRAMKGHQGGLTDTNM